jgi:ribulose-phosphate 3-epimerase
MKASPDWLAALPKHRLLAEYSLWSADLIRLADDMARVEPHVDIWHVDVADGHFSTAFLFFPDLVAACRKRTAKPIHVHLMCADAILASQVDQFAEAGADLISVHGENADARDMLARIKGHGLAAGIVLKVETPVAAAAPFIGDIAFLTLLGTRIGVKGQGLDPTACPRLGEAKALIGKRAITLAADGGIRENTVPLLRGAGAETIVMGSLAFGAADFAARMAWVRAMPGHA